LQDAASCEQKVQALEQRNSVLASEVKLAQSQLQELSAKAKRIKAKVEESMATDTGSSKVHLIGNINVVFNE
jgi:predicted RNase H-like nuclease (RuvC/YqgF family)